MMSAAERVVGYQVRSVSPPYTRGSIELLEVDPSFMLRLSKQQGTFLGELYLNWVAISPENQSVPEESDGSQIMIFPHRDRLVNLSTLALDELSLAGDFALSFLEYAKRRAKQMAVTGFNFCQDPRERKIRPQSWPQFHMHMILFPSQIERLPKLPRPLRELGFRRTEQVLSHFPSWVCGDGIERIDIASEQPNIAPFLPRGGLLFRFTEQTPFPVEVAKAIKRLHESYQVVHAKIFSLFTNNYEVVRNSQWQMAFELRKPTEMAEQIASSDLPDILRSHLTLAASVLQEENSTNNSHEKILRSPSYSTAFFLGQDGRLYLFFKPHFLSSAGFPHAVGINVIRRQQEGANLTQRIERAGELFQILS